MSFDLANVLSQAAGRDTGIDPGREKIEYIPIEKIGVDYKNFYSMDGIDELARNIDFVGLQQPLRVIPWRWPSRPDEDAYKVVSGHRRLAALQRLQRKTVPCIVENHPDEPEALQELRLIFANSDTRKMTGPDLQQQARRIRELLLKLKDDGYEFKGRMRDHVAQICGVSKSKLSRLDAIEKNLHQGIKNAYYSTGKLNETTAYEISKMPMKMQSEVCRKLGKGWDPTADDIRKWWGNVVEGGFRQTEADAEDDLKKIQDTIKKEYDLLTESVPTMGTKDGEQTVVYEEVYIDPGKTVISPEWQRGDPPHEGRYLCLVDLNTTRLHEQKCDYRDGQWLAFGSPIMDMFKVLAWWPLPKDPKFMTSTDLRDLDVEQEAEV